MPGRQRPRMRACATGTERAGRVQTTTALGQTEAALLDQLIGKRGLATILGWVSAHFRPGIVMCDGEVSYRTPCQGDAQGWPDLTLVRPPRIVFAELKAEDGHLLPEQRRWLDILDDCGQEVYLWRPSDFDEIQQILTLGHVLNLIEMAECPCSWQNRRGH